MYGARRGLELAERQRMNPERIELLHQPAGRLTVTLHLEHAPSLGGDRSSERGSHERPLATPEVVWRREERQAGVNSDAQAAGGPCHALRR